MTEVDWLKSEQGLQAAAWRQLRDMFATTTSAAHCGCRTIGDVSKYIKDQQERIYEVIGDCPE